MKTFRSVVITIALAVAYWAIANYIAERNDHGAPKPTQQQGIFESRQYDLDMVEMWYKAYNKRFFGDKLPRTTMFLWTDTHELPPDYQFLGTTMCTSSHVCVISIDQYYNRANVTAQLTLLHEMCHIETYDPTIDQHGPRWKGCMARLYSMKALEDLL